MIALPSEIARKLMLSVGTHKSGRPLFPVEVAAAMKQALDSGTQVEELAEALHFDGPTMIRRFTRLLDLPLELQPLIGWGADSSTLSFSTASEIARLPLGEQITAGKAVLTHQLNLSEVRQLVQLRHRSGKSIDETIGAVLQQRAVVVRRHVIVGAVTSEETQIRLKAVSQEGRNAVIRSVLDQYFPHTNNFGAKLGVDTFVLVGDDRFQAIITALPGGFEQTITQYIGQELSRQG